MWQLLAAVFVAHALVCGGAKSSAQTSQVAGMCDLPHLKTRAPIIRPLYLYTCICILYSLHTIQIRQSLQLKDGRVDLSTITGLAKGLSYGFRRVSDRTATV